MSPSPRPRLVFIHGTSGYKHPQKWLEPLNASLDKFGVSAWDTRSVPEVDYKALLNGPNDAGKVLAPRPVEVGRERTAEFDANRRALAHRLDRYPRHKKPWGAQIPDVFRAGTANQLRALWPDYRHTAEAYRTRRDAVREYVREVAGTW